MASSATVPYARRVLRLLRARAPSSLVFLAILLLFENVRAWSLGQEADAAMLIVPMWVMAAAPIAPVLVEKFSTGSAKKAR